MTHRGDASAEVNGDAAPAAAIVALVDPDPDAAFCSVISAEDDYSASIPLPELVEGGWFTFRMEDDDLPPDMSPIRLTVVRGRTLCWNVKNVGELHFTADKQPDSVPERPSH